MAGAAARCRMTWWTPGSWPSSGRCSTRGLAALYLQRARETGAFEDYRRAERLARRSLALRVAHNGKTYALLAATLLAQHRFTEARDVARTLNARDPGVPSQRALLAEVELELGRYGAAGGLFDSLWPARHELSVAPRLARWAEIRGDTALARRLLDGALAAARQRHDLPAEQLAWFHLRVGDFALRYGRLGAAEYARAMEVAVLGQPGQWHRAWSLFLLEHHRRLPEVLAQVREELKSRRDVYGYDLLAWALHQAGRDAEAREPMARALALGTRDPQLLRHAAAIARARP